MKRRRTTVHHHPLLAVFTACACSFFSGATYETHAQTYEGFSQPFREIKVAASEGGRIAAVFAKRGAIVRENDILLKLDCTVLDGAKRVAKAKAENTSRIDALKVEAEIKKDRFNKVNRLFENGAGSPEESKRAEADAKVADLNVRSAVEEKALSELELAEIEARISQRQVRSPIGGIVTDVLKDAGEYVSLSDPQVATIVQLDKLRVTFFIPTDLATSLKVGDSLPLTVPIVNRKGAPNQVTAEIEYISAITEPDSGRVRMDVIIANTKRHYRSGVRCLFIAQ